MNDLPLQDFTRHALETAPKECCGLIVLRKGRETYVRCRNMSTDPEGCFILNSDDYAAAEDLGDVVAVCHSHPHTSAAPTESDMVGIEASSLPWYILAVPSCTLTQTFPTGWRAPLIGRNFFFGTLDCYSLCRDYYKEAHNIDLPNYDRTDKFWERGENLYMDNFGAAGFFEITRKELRAGDAILMNIFSPIPNHAAIYLGGNLILHHLQDRISGREVYGGYYAKVSTHFLRNVKLC